VLKGDLQLFSGVLKGDLQHSTEQHRHHSDLSGPVGIKC
jgi:hypothetical protein